MSERSSANAHGFGTELARRIDAVCRRFEGDWRSGRSPVRGDYLGEVPEVARRALEAELVGLQDELRRVDETLARIESSPITKAATFAPASPPTILIPGLANPLVDEEATVAPAEPVTLDHLGSRPSPEVVAPTRVRYFGEYAIVREWGRLRKRDRWA
ncbi:hypothetical protein ACYOEI_08575 [Singulisphaera rosea]